MNFNGRDTARSTRVQFVCLNARHQPCFRQSAFFPSEGFTERYVSQIRSASATPSHHHHLPRFPPCRSNASKCRKRRKYSCRHLGKNFTGLWSNAPFQYKNHYLTLNFKAACPSPAHLETHLSAGSLVDFKIAMVL